MLLKVTPMSNAERQREFQARHPGYDRRRKSRERASAKRGAARVRAMLSAQAKAAQVAAILAPPQRLMLPAPGIDPMLMELNALAASLRSATAREPLPLPRT